MSYVDKSILKGTEDQTLSFYVTTQVIGTAQILIDALTQFNAYIKAYRIVNNDGLNVITYRAGSNTQPLKTIPINSQEEVSGWESFLQINPNAVTGQGFLEMDLIDRNEALRNGRQN